MAGRTQKVTLKFEADVTGAKQSLSELNKLLNNITKAGSSKNNFSYSMQQAAESAKVLKNSLNDAMNFDTGRLDFSKFTSNLGQANTSLSQVITNLSRVKSVGNTAINQLSTQLSQAQVPITKMGGAIGSMLDTLSRTIKWTFASNFVHQIEGAYKAAITYAQNLNETLVSIQQVSNASFADMQKFATQANAVAKALSTTTKAYADASLIYYQQGDTQEMAAKKAEITLKATNSAFSASAQEMSQMLTATWNAYQAGADQLEHYVDVMAALGANTATSLEEISGALQKVASTANVTGVSMEKMSSMIATVSSTTRQSAEVVGTAFNTVLGRISSLKLGETLEDGVNLTKYTSALQSIGVNVLDATGDLRDMGTVIEEIGNKWSILSTSQKTALASTIGGVRQYTNIMALFNNWDKYKENLDITANSDGQLTRMQNIYAEGWEGARKRTKAAMESIYETIIDDRAMIDMQNNITAVVESLNDLIKGLGGLPGILFTVASLMNQAFGDKIVNGFSNLSFKALSFVDAVRNNTGGKENATMGGNILRTGLQMVTGRYVGAQQREQAEGLRQIAFEGARMAAETKDPLAKSLYVERSKLLHDQASLIDFKDQNGKLISLKESGGVKSAWQRQSMIDQNVQQIAAINRTLDIQEKNAEYMKGTVVKDLGDHSGDPDAYLRKSPKYFKGTTMSLQTDADRTAAFFESRRLIGADRAAGATWKPSQQAQVTESDQIMADLRASGYNKTGIIPSDIQTRINDYFAPEIAQRSTIDRTENLRAAIYGADYAKYMGAGNVTGEEIAIAAGYRIAQSELLNNQLNEIRDNSKTWSDKDKVINAEKVLSRMNAVGIEFKTGKIHQAIEDYQTRNDSAKNLTEEQKQQTVDNLLKILTTKSTEQTIRGHNDRILKEAEKDSTQSEGGAARAESILKGRRVAYGQQSIADSEIDRLNGGRTQSVIDRMKAVSQNIGKMSQSIMGAAISVGRGFTSMNSAIESFQGGNLTQKISGVMNAVTGFAQSMAYGLPGVIAYAVGTIASIVTQIVKTGEEAKKVTAQNITEDITKRTTENKEKASKAITATTQYAALQSQYENGIITQQEYESSLLSTAEALGVQGAAVMALQGRYDDLASAIENTTKKQMEQAHETAKELYQESKDQIGNLWINEKEDANGRMREKNGQYVWNDSERWYTDKYTWGGVEHEAGDLSVNDIQSIQAKLSEALGYEVALSGNYAGEDILKPNTIKGKWLINEILGTTAASAPGHAEADDLVLGSTYEELSEVYAKGKKVRELISDSSADADVVSLLKSLGFGTSGEFSNFMAHLHNVIANIDTNRETQWKTGGNAYMEEHAGEIDLDTYGSDVRASLIESVIQAFNDKDLGEPGSETYEAAHETAEAIVDGYIESLYNGADITTRLKAATANYKKALKDKKYTTEDLPELGSAIWEYTSSAVIGAAYKNMSPDQQDSVLNAYQKRGYYQSARTALAHRFNAPIAESIDVVSNINSIYDAVNILSNGEFELPDKSELAKMDRQALYNLYNSMMEFLSETVSDGIETAEFKEDQTILQQTIDDAKSQIMNGLYKSLGLTEEQIGQYTTIDDLKSWAEREKNTEEGKGLYGERIGLINTAAQEFESVDQSALAVLDTTIPQQTARQLEQRIKAYQSLATSTDNINIDKLDQLNDIFMNEVNVDDWINMSELERKQKQLQLMRESLQEYANVEGADSNRVAIYTKQIADLQAEVDSLNFANIQAEVERVTKEWEEMGTAAESAFSTIQSSLGSLDSISFESLESLRQNLLDAGIAGEKVAQIINDIKNAGKSDNKEEIWAGLTAATQATLTAITANDQKLRGYQDLVSQAKIDEINASEAIITPDPIPVNGQVSPESAASITADTKEAVKAADGAEVKPVVETEQIGADVTEAIIEADGSKVIYMADGSTVTGDIDYAVQLANGEKFIHMSDGSTLQGDVATAVIEADGSKTIVMADGSTLKGDITSVVENSNGDIDVTLSNKSKLSIPQSVRMALKGDTSKPQTFDVNLLAAGDLQGQINAMNLSANVKLNLSGNGASMLLEARSKRMLDSLGNAGAEEAMGILNSPWDSMIEQMKAPVWSDAAEYTFTSQASKMANMSGVDLEALGAEKLNEYVQALQKAAQSEDDATASIAQMLLDGIGVGLKDADIDWDSYLAPLGEKVEQAFRNALQIHSPSQLTQALAPFLLEGLSVGLEEGIQNFDPSKSLNGLGAKISQGFKDQLLQAIDDFKNSKEYKNELQKLFDKFEKEEGRKLTDEEKQQIENQNSSSIVDKYFNNDKINKESENYMRSFLHGSYKSSGKYDLYEIAAITNAITALGDIDIENADEAKLTEWINIVENNIDEMYESIVNKSKSAWASLKDVWKSGLTQLFEADDKKVQDYYNTWVDTFKAISKARQGLLKGDSILETFAEDEAGLARLLNSSDYLNQNLSFDQMMQLLQDPTLRPQDLQYDKYNPIQSLTGKNAFLNRDVEGHVLHTEYGDKNTEGTYAYNKYQKYKEIIAGDENGSFLQSIDTLLTETPETIIEIGEALKANGHDLTEFFSLKNGKYASMLDDIDPMSLFEALFGSDFLDTALNSEGYKNQEQVDQGYSEAYAQQLIQTYKEQEQAMMDYADSVGYTKQEFKELRAELQEAGGLSMDTPAAIEHLNAITAAVANYKTGLEELQKISKDTWKSMKKEIAADTASGRKNISTLRDSMSKMLGVDATNISSNFVKTHLKNLEKMSTGTKEEVQAAEEAIRDDLVKEVTKSAKELSKPITIQIDANTTEVYNDVSSFFQDVFDRWDGEDLGFTISAETDGAEASVISALNSMLASGQMTATSISEALNAIGWEPQIEWEAVSAQDYASENLSGGYQMIGGKYVPITGSVEETADMTVYIPKIKGASKTGGSGSKKPSDGGGGGGKKKKERKDDNDKERYHQIDRRITQQNKLLEKNDKLKQQKYGQDYINSLTKENALIQKQITLNQKKLKEAKKYLKQDRKDLESYGATFDKEGNVNYEDYMDKWIKWYNEKAEAYEKGKITDDDWEDIEDEWDDAMKALENYEEAQDIIADMQNEILEKQNQISANNLEKITYKLELQIKLNENDVKRLDYFIKKYANSYNSLQWADESYNAMQDKAEKYEASLEAVSEAIADLDAKYAAGEITTADYVNGLESSNEKLIEYLSNLDELDKAMREWYGETLKEARTELDKLTAVMEHENTVFSNYIEILKLTGYEEDYGKMIEIYDAQITASQTKTEMLQQHLNTLNEEKKKLEETLELHPDDEYAKQQLEDLEAEIRTTEEDIQTSAITTLNAIKNKWIATIDDITQENKKSVSTTGEDLDWVKQKWQWWNDEQEFYVDTVTELYEINKLNRKIEDQLAKTRDKNNQRELRQLQDEINLKSESGQLTKYDLEMMDLQYQLLLKRQELEDAQNAKSTVTLTRDENGNYIYQYTADQDLVSKKAQEYEDVLYQINQKADEEYKNLGNKLLQYEEEMANALDTLMRDQNLSQEERQKRYQEIMDHYVPLIQNTADQMGVVEQNLLINQSVWTTKYGLDIQKNAGVTNDQVTSIMNGLIVNVGNFISTCENNFEVRYKDALDRMQEKQAEITKLINADWDSMKERLENVTDKAKETKDAASELDDVIRDSLSGIRTATDAWKLHYEQLKLVIKKYEDLNKKILQLLELLAKLDAVQGTETTGESQSEGDNPTSEGDNPTGEGDNPTGGGNNPTGGGNSNTPKGWTVTTNGTAHKFTVYKDAVSFASNARTSYGSEYSAGYSQSGLSADTIKKLADAYVAKMVQGPTPYYLHGGPIDYTGPAWVDGSKTNPEYVLNAKQTDEMFKLLNSNTIETLITTMKNATIAMLAGLRGGLISYNSAQTESHATAQEVTIYAEFPAATNRDEIREALDGLVARASQNAATFIK